MAAVFNSQSETLADWSELESAAFSSSSAEESHEYDGNVLESLSDVESSTRKSSC